jgi:toxin ParE1/3/4
MKQRVVIFAPEARDDLIALYEWIADAASEQVAIGYVQRLETFCKGLAHAAERGRARPDIRPTLRVVGFERRATVAFSVEQTTVEILRVFPKGKDWEEEFT